MWEERLKLYDSLVNECSRFDRKGKNMPYTSANGYMFSLLNKDGEIGIRFSKEKQQEYLTKYDTSFYKSYGAIMQGYILIPEYILQNDKSTVIKLLNESYAYVMSLPSK